MKTLILIITLALTGALGTAQSTPNNPFPTGNVPVPGVFNSLFDPPLFQCYSAAVGCNAVLSATGAQTGIDLRGTPIDTHSIKFSPVGTVSTCQVQMESSADGVTWNSADIVPSTLCTSKGQVVVTVPGVAFIRVNLTVLTGGGSLNVVYGGRFAPTGTAGGTGAVSNAQWVQAGQVIWAQYTTQAIGTVAVHQSANIITTGGTVTNTTWDVASCAMSTVGGYGTGFTVATSGWLQGFTAYLVTSGFPQGTVLINLYILNSMPSGGSTSTCVNTLVASNIGTILGTWPSGSSLPASFIGTTSQFVSAWSVPGFTTTLVPSNPSAGSDFSYAISGVSASARVCIQSINFTLTTSATVASRTVGLQLTFNSSANPFMMYIAPIAQPASTTEAYSFTPGGTNNQYTVSGPVVFQSVPFANGGPVCFNSGLTGPLVRSVTQNLQAADQFSSIGIVVQEQQDNN